MGTKAWLRDVDGTMTPNLTTADAIVHAITTLKTEGGGTVWIHRLSCLEFRDHTECSCDPIGVVVDGEDFN